MYKQIKKEANLRKNTVDYLKKFPHDITYKEEKYWCQIQYLLDRLEVHEGTLKELEHFL